MNGLPPGFELDPEPGGPDYEALYAEADRVNGLPPGFTKAISDAETGHIRDDALRNRVRSPANAYGRMQFIPETGARYGLNTIADLQDPLKAIPAGGRHLGDLMRQFGKPELAAAAYNAGAGAVTKYGGIPPYKETQKYVPRVMKNLGSSQHVASMREKYAPNLFQQAAGGLFDAIIPSAQAADQPPPGNGVMLPQGFEVDAEPQAMGGLPPGFELDPEPEAQQAPPSGLPPTAQTAIRSTAKGLSAPVTMAMDAINSPVNLIAKGVNALRPGTMDYLPPTSTYVDRALQAGGVDPRAASNAERAVTAGLGAASGAGLAGLVGRAGAAVAGLGRGPLPGAPPVLGGTAPTAYPEMAAQRVLNPATQQFTPEMAAEATRRAIMANPGTAAEAIKAGSPQVGGILGAIAPAVSSAPSIKPALSAMSASGASDMAREAGASPAMQIGAGIVGGMLPGVGQGVLNAAGSTAGRIVAPFTQGGKEKIAGRVLNKQAAAPDAARARLANPEFTRELVPGSRPTTAEVTQDPGLARLQRVLPSSQTAIDAGVEQVNAARITQMDRAIRDTLDRVNKAPKTGAVDVIDKIGLVKQRIGQTFEDQLRAKGIDPAELTVATPALEAKLADLTRRHQGNKNLEALIGATGTAIEEGTNFTRLWNNRQSLDDLIYEKLLTATAGSKADMKRVGQEIRSAMNDDLIAAVPEFKPFLDRYARMSRAEGRLKLGRELVAKSENTARNIADEDQLYGDRTLSGAKLDRLDVAGAERRAGAKLSKPQRAALTAAQEEKRRANVLTTGGAPVNSATAQNLAVNQIISDDIMGGLLGDNTRTGLAGFARNLMQSVPGRVADAATKPAQADVMRLIQRGLIDPEEGARLMNIGRLRNTQALMPSLVNAGRSGILSEIYARMGR